MWHGNGGIIQGIMTVMNQFIASLLNQLEIMKLEILLTLITILTLTTGIFQFMIFMETSTT